MQSPPPVSVREWCIRLSGRAPTLGCKAARRYGTREAEADDKIEKKKKKNTKKKTVNQIVVKVSDLETQMKSLDTRLTQNEKSCEFVSKTHETKNNELKAAKDSLSKLQTKCQDLASDTQSMKQKQESLNAKLRDLESHAR